MTAPLRILLVEDSDDDAELLLEELRRGGYAPEWERVDTADALTAALRQPWEVITCDYVMPRLTAQAALEIVTQRLVDTPVIIVSGEVGEEVAVAAMKAGAVDFVSKHKLARLVPAIERELREAEERRARRRAEEALLVSARRYRDVVETSHDLIWSVDAHGCFTFANQAARQVLGYAPAELLGRPFTDFFSPERAGESQALLAQLQAGRGLSGYDMEVRRSDGEAVVLRCNAAILRDADGCVTGATGTSHDVTVRKRAEEERAQLRRGQNMEAIGRLAAGVAHEFNNQLTVVKGSAQLLLAKLAPDDSARRDAERITVAVDRSARLVHQLLTFGRQGPLDARPLNLTDIVIETSAMLRLLLGEQLSLRVATVPNLHPVLADRSQVEQLLMHLVTTARDALAPEGRPPTGSVVVLQTANATPAEMRQHVAPVDRDAGAYARLTVHDDGPAIPAAALEHVFEPFFSTKELGRGTGFGLATVFGIVQQHRGYIACSSGPERGTAFNVYWPATPGGAAPAPAHQTPAPPGQRVRTTSATILVVEDEGDVRALLVRTLMQAGHRVYSASTAGEALSVAARIGAALDLLVTDVVMPGDSGAVLARQLRQLQPDVPVLFISGHLADPLDLAALPGAQFLPKPFGLTDLLTAVADLLARQRPAER